MRVPHESESGFARGRVRDRPRRWDGPGGTDGTHGRVGPEVRASAKPGAGRKDVRIRQSCGTASRNIAERRRLQWLVVILAPLEVIDRCGRARVVTVGVRSTRKFGVGVA